MDTMLALRKLKIFIEKCITDLIPWVEKQDIQEKLSKKLINVFESFGLTILNLVENKEN